MGKVSKSTIYLTVAFAIVLGLNVVAVMKIISLQKIVENLTRTIEQERIGEKSEMQKEANMQNQVLDTSNWKTYRNEQYEFEVKYPNNWRGFGEGRLVNFQGGLEHGGIRPRGGADIDMGGIETKASVADLIKSELGNDPSDLLVATTTLLLGEITATKAHTSYHFTGFTEERIDVYVPYNSALITLGLSYYGNDETAPQILADFDQILSTFKFTK